MVRTKKTTAAVTNFTRLRLVNRNLGGGASDPNPLAAAGLTIQELTDFTALVRRVDRDRPARSDLDALQQALIAHPGLWRAAGDLASSAIDTMIAQTGLPAAQSLALRRGAGELQATLAGPGASPLETALSEQIAVCWIRLRISEAAFADATNTGDPVVIKFWEERVAAAQRRCQSACESLARIRRLAVCTPALLQVNIAAPPDDFSREHKAQALAALGMTEEEAAAKAAAEGHPYIPPWLGIPSSPEEWAELEADVDRGLAEFESQLDQASAEQEAEAEQDSGEAELEQASPEAEVERTSSEQEAEVEQESAEQEAEVERGSAEFEAEVEPLPPYDRCNAPTSDDSNPRPA